MSSTQQFTCRVSKRMWVSFISPFLNIFLFWYDDACLFWFVDVSLDVFYFSFYIQNQLDSMPTTYEEDLEIQSSLLQGTVPKGWQGATDILEQVDTLCNIKWQSWASKISWGCQNRGFHYNHCTMVVKCRSRYPTITVHWLKWCPLL